MGSLAAAAGMEIGAAVIHVESGARVARTAYDLWASGVPEAR